MIFTKILSALLKAKIKISNNQKPAFSLTAVRFRPVPCTLKVDIPHYS